VQQLCRVGLGDQFGELAGNLPPWPPILIHDTRVIASHLGGKAH